jgi:uncharacterized protein (TIGR03000 family)
MVRKAFLYGGMLAIAGAAILATPGLSWAQHGGGHGGGGHFGGGHIGGGHFGAGHFAGGRIGGFRGGFYHGSGYHHYYPGYGSHRYYPGYGLYGYYPYGYDDYPYYADAYSYGGSVPAYDYGSYFNSSPVIPNPGATFSADAYYAAVAPSTAPAQSDKVAHMTVQVPADAEVWFGKTKTTSTGSVRHYESPPLTPGSQYTYQIRARWNQNGQEVTQTQLVNVTAGGRVNVTFTVRPKDGGAGVGR